jgi:hypothetical protein
MIERRMMNVDSTYPRFIRVSRLRRMNANMVECKAYWLHRYDMCKRYSAWLGLRV